MTLAFSVASFEGKFRQGVHSAVSIGRYDGSAIQVFVVQGRKSQSIRLHVYIHKELGIQFLCQNMLAHSGVWADQIVCRVENCISSKNSTMKFSNRT